MNALDEGWFNDIADFLGDAYWAPGTSRVASFTTGTVQEVDFLADELGLPVGARFLDVGCGPGRHALELARRGYDVVGVDLSSTFLAMAETFAEREGLAVRFELADVRELSFVEEFDAVICLCQGGFGLLGGSEDAELVRRLASALRPGGWLALSAFSSYFAVSALEEDERFDAGTGVLTERSTLTAADGAQREFQLWTTCFTPRELRLLAEAAGLTVHGLYAVAPGRYGRNEPDLDHPEHLLVARARGAENGPSLSPTGAGG